MIYRSLGILFACLLCAVVASSSEILTEKRFASRINDTQVNVSLTTADWQAIPAISSRVLSKEAHRYAGKFVKFTGVVGTVLPKSARGRSLEMMPYHYDVYVETPGIHIQLNTLRLCEESDFISDRKHRAERDVAISFQRGHRYEFCGFAVRYEAHLRYHKRGSEKVLVIPFSVKHLGIAE